MERQVYIPPEYAETDKPTIFLAGPIQGARDWQSDAIRIIKSLNPEIVIASPRRERFKGIEGEYERQVNWETYHLKKAGGNGVIMFWLAKEEEHIPGRAYAQTTRFELGEWFGKSDHLDTKIVLGIEKGFSGERYVRHRFGDRTDVPVFKTLDEACISAAFLAIPEKN